MKKAKVEKVVVKNVFITFDGGEWDDYEAALYHEINAFVEYGELKIFTSKGLPTKDMDSACTVFLGTLRATEAFVMLNEYEGYTTKGLDESSLGWFFWEENEWVDPYDKIEKIKKEVNETLKLCGGDPID
jgi:hypothetical protein